MAPALIAASAAVLGVLIGLFVPLINGRIENKRLRRETDRLLCERVLELFEEQADTIYDELTGHGSLRRKLLLRSSRIDDHRSRADCARLVEMATDPSVSREDLLIQWAETVDSLALRYRSL